MGKLAQRLRDAGKSGVYRVTSAKVPREAGREAGLALFELPLEALADKKALLRQFATVLAFPEWFGGNWDALGDCLTDLSWRDAGGYVLLVHGAAAFATRCADDYGVLIDVLGASAQSWRERDVPFFAVCVDPGGALALPALYNDSK